jgi:hypothetical protein
MAAAQDVTEYDASQDADRRAICERLSAVLDAELPEAESKVWHGHPVWFLGGNPVAGYAARKAGVQLLFWSGRSFGEPGLRPEGTFKAAEARYASADEIDEDALRRWAGKARDIQWDYKNIRATKGVLSALTPMPFD